MLTTSLADLSASFLCVNAASNSTAIKLVSMRFKFSVLALTVVDSLLFVTLTFLSSSTAVTFFGFLVMATLPTGCLATGMATRLNCESVAPLLV
ncbi:hypothetical protein BpHYR1_032837 [Brachionus plicatilis]|uniref:Uncharacterized protein n=1 Tax=Brachionus plicatilis TaxID=10195 RepID=A0A3M7QNT1_BRAPC|nr:hypothetical protein BpHYR1_032837 [Brachionus plicatilis]